VKPQSSIIFAEIRSATGTHRAHRSASYNRYDFSQYAFGGAENFCGASSAFARSERRRRRKHRFECAEQAPKLLVILPRRQTPKVSKRLASWSSL